MLVVSDTTPLISLLKINQIDLLRRLFGEVVIPYAVYEELTVDKRFEEEAECIKNKNFIIIKDVESQESVDILRKVSGLDKGESEAIVLSNELNADIILMDEVKGRTVSGQMDLDIMGTIGILMAAYEENEITAQDVVNCVDGLQKAGRHISNKYYQMLLERLK